MLPEVMNNIIGVSTLHTDIIETHILTRLDGPSLASTSSCSTTLHHLSSSDTLWTEICHSTWPSTMSDQLSRIVTSFGPSNFFSEAFPLPPTSNVKLVSPPPKLLISAVDIFYKDILILSKVQEMETETGWFRCSPFMIDMLEPKDVVPSPIDGEDTCTEIESNMRLSWILVDPVGERAVNLSSNMPVSIHRHSLTGEVHVRFDSILAGGNVHCGILVTCGWLDGTGENMQVREVSVQMEDVDGVYLNGKDSLVILQQAMEGRKGSGRNRVEEGQRRYKKYVEKTGKRRERKLKTKRTLYTLCVAFGISVFLACSMLSWEDSLTILVSCYYMVYVLLHTQ